MSPGETPKTWDVKQLLGSISAEHSFSVILLNQPITPAHQETVKQLWERATFRLCADGGANRLYDAYRDDVALPHEIRGDLDSLRDEVWEYYRGKGVMIEKVPSQYATDLQKCILRVEEYEEKGSVGEMELIILGGLSGRLDQTMHTLHVLCQLTMTDGQQAAKVSSSQKRAHLEQDDFAVLNRRKRTWVFSENSLVWVLGKGSHLIKLDLARNGPTCGLMPLVSQVQPGTKGIKVWSKGLRWDLDGTPSAIGGFLSTSNHLKEEQVTITAEGEIIWTVEMRHD